MKNILITGGSGYSGKYLNQHLSKKKVNVLSTFRKKKNSRKNYINLNLLRKIKLNYKCDWIIHTASHHKIIDFKKKPKLKFNNNVNMIKNLINFAKEKKIKHFIFYSTFDLNYPKKNKKKLVYIKSKIKSEKLLISALKKGIFKKLFILRLPAIIGKNSNTTFIVDVFKKMKKNNKILIWNYNDKFNTVINIHDLNKLVYYLINLKINKKLLIIDCLSSGSLKLLNLIRFMLKKIQSKSTIQLLNKKNTKNVPKLNNKISYKFCTVKNTVLKFINEVST